MKHLEKYLDDEWFEPMPAPRKREKNVEKAIRLYAIGQGCLVRKFTSPGRRNVPDRVIIAPGGMCGWLEVKRPGKKPTPGQQYELDLMEAHGCYVGYADTLERGKEFVDGLLLL